MAARSGGSGEPVRPGEGGEGRIRGVRQEPPRSVFVPPSEFEEMVASGHFELGAEAARHMSGALRLRDGAPLLIYDGAGRGATGNIVSSDRRSLRVQATGFFEVARRPYRTTLFQAVIKGPRFDTVVEKATELGVDRITPVIFEHSVAEPGGSGASIKRLDRWRRIAAEAAKQCERGILPILDEPVSLNVLLERDVDRDAERDAERDAPPRLAGFDVVIIPWEGASAESEGYLSERMEAAAARGHRPINCAVVIGPEGGLSEAEIELLSTDPSSMVVSLGPDILRSETAAIATLALVGQAVRVALMSTAR